VGADGIVVLTWEVPSDGGTPAVELDTGLRTRHATDRARLVDAVRHLTVHTRPVSAADPATPETPAETPAPEDK
jgi:hypothetical protein